MTDVVSYRERVQAGICASCGARPAREGAVQCEQCIEKKAEHHAELLRLHLCVRCKRPALPDLSTCALCRDKMRTHLADRHADRANAGLCTRCAKPVDQDGRICRACTVLQATYRKNRKERLKAEGLCQKCGKKAVIPDTTRCPTCTEKCNAYLRRFNATRKSKNNDRVKAYKQRKIAEGKCYRCGKRKPVKGRTKCAECIERCRVQSAIRWANKMKAKRAAQGIVDREANDKHGLETERERRARVNAEKAEIKKQQLAALADPHALKAKMDEHNLSVHDIAVLHGIPESLIRQHLATIGVHKQSRNGWQTQNDKKRALAEAAAPQ